MFDDEFMNDMLLNQDLYGMDDDEDEMLNENKDSIDDDEMI